MDLLLALIFHVFITTSCPVSTTITLHVPLILKNCPFLLEKIMCCWLLGNRERPISIFASKNGHFFNINGACKAIDVDPRHEIMIKTWKTSANNRSFSISQEPIAQPTVLYFLKCQMDNFQLMMNAKLLMLIQGVK